MLKNKLYESVKQYLDKYLFGFDPSQLELSVLKGNINLTNVNLKPNKANKFLQYLMIPFALKAGTIGKLELKVSLIQMWNGPVEITIDDLFLVLGPNLGIVSHDESFVEEGKNQLDESYDEGNMYNIFEHQLKLKKKTSSDKEKAQQKPKQAQDQQQPMEKQTLDFIKNLKLKINRFHLRFEDDYFSSEQPYSFGVVFDKLVWESTDKKWIFDNIGAKEPKLQNFQTSMGILKNLELQNLRCYWNSMSEMYIPASLWESTRHMKQGIFEAMEVSDLKNMLCSPFIKEKEKQLQYIVTSTNVKNQILYLKQVNSKKQEDDQIEAIVMFSQPFSINVTPQLVEDVNSLTEFCQNYFLSKDLKQYRPHRKPITNLPPHLENNESIKRKRKLIVRDWFFYVVWYVRLRKILRNLYSTELLQQELESNSKYDEILKILDNPQSSMTDLKYNFSKDANNHLQQDASPSFQQQEYNALQVKNIIKIFNLRLEHLDINLYSKHQFESLHPSFSIGLSSVAFESNLQSLPSKTHCISGIIKEVDVSTYIQRTKLTEQNKRMNAIEHPQSTIASSFQSDAHNPFKERDEYYQNHDRRVSNNLNQQNARSPNNIQMVDSMRNYNKSNNVSTISNQKENQDDKKQEKSLFGAMFDKMFSFGSNSEEGLAKSKTIIETSSQNNNFTYSSSNNNRTLSSGISTGNIHNANSNLSRLLSSQQCSDISNNKIPSMADIIQQKPAIHNRNGNGNGRTPNSKNGGMSTSRGLTSGGCSSSKHSNSKGVGDILNNMLNDPIHKFILSSDMSIKDLKINIEEVNKQNKAIRNDASNNDINYPQNSNTQFKMMNGLQNSSYLNDENEGYQNKIQSSSNSNNIIKHNKMVDQRQYLRQNNVKNNIPIPQANNNNSKRNQASKQDMSQLSKIISDDFSLAGNQHYDQHYNQTVLVQSNPQQRIHSYSQNSHQNIQQQPGGAMLPLKVFKDLSHQEQIIKHTIFQLRPSGSSNQCIYVRQEKTTSQKEGEKSLYKIKASIGESQIDYTNDILKEFFELIIELKKLTTFRDVSMQRVVSRESRETTAQRKIELMMPFYIVRKLVQNHKGKVGDIKQLLHNQKGGMTQPAVNMWNQQINKIDEYFRNYLLDASISIQKAQVTLYSQNDQQFCKLQSPQITASLFKFNHDCGFEILGFQFSGLSSLHIVSDFANSMNGHLQFIKQHPAIQRGVNFYDELHNEYKNKLSFKKQNAQKKRQSQHNQKKRHQSKHEQQQAFQDISNRKDVFKKQMTVTDKLYKNESGSNGERPCPNINFINKLQDKKHSIIIQNNMGEAPNQMFDQHSKKQKSKAQGKYNNYGQEYDDVIALEVNYDGQHIRETEGNEDIDQESDEILRQMNFSSEINSPTNNKEFSDFVVTNKVTLPHTNNEQIKQKSNHYSAQQQQLSSFDHGLSGDSMLMGTSQYTTLNKIPMQKLVPSSMKPSNLMGNHKAGMKEPLFEGILGNPLRKQKTHQQVKENSCNLMKTSTTNVHSVVSSSQSIQQQKFQARLGNQQMNQGLSHGMASTSSEQNLRSMLGINQIQQLQQNQMFKGKW